MDKKVPLWKNVWNNESIGLISKGMEKAQNVMDPANIVWREA